VANGGLIAKSRVWLGAGLCAPFQAGQFSPAHTTHNRDFMTPEPSGNEQGDRRGDEQPQAGRFDERNLARLRHGRSDGPFLRAAESQIGPRSDRGWPVRSGGSSHADRRQSEKHAETMIGEILRKR
jgi:hypothetical protein